MKLAFIEIYCDMNFVQFSEKKASNDKDSGTRVSGSSGQAILNFGNLCSAEVSRPFEWLRQKLHYPLSIHVLVSELDDQRNEKVKYFSACHPAS